MLVSLSGHTEAVRPLFSVIIIVNYYFIYFPVMSVLMGFTADILRTNTGVTNDGSVPLSVTASQINE